MAKPRICHISPLSIHSYRWIEAFRQKDYDVSLINDCSTFNAPEPYLIRTYTLPTLNRTNAPYRLISNYAQVFTILRKTDPDLVNLHVQHHYTPPIMLARYPFILTSWGGEVLALAGTELLGKRLATFAARKAKAIIVDARILRDIWIKLGIDKSKIHVIPFGVDTNTFNRQANSNAVKNDLHLDKDSVVTISTRFLFNHHYNIDCLIKAIPLIRKEHEEARFLIKGSGPLEGYLRRLTEKLGVSDSVRFVGLVPHDKVAQYLSAADIYVSTCYVDSTSVSLLEAMACGLAPVVTDIAGNREWIEDGVNGFLFQPRNSEVLAEKINQLIEDPQRRKSFGRKCAQIIAQRATWEKCVSNMEEVYEALL